MSTSKNSLGFARVVATIAAAMITAAIISVAILVLAAAGADGAENVSHSQDIQTSGAAEAKPAPPAAPHITVNFSNLAFPRSVDVAGVGGRHAQANMEG